MRNLKRALSLALASVMVMGLMVVGSGAVSYTDVSSKNNQEAIEVLQAVGVMTGDEKGNFNPDQKVTRNEMAVVMANLLKLSVNDFAGSKTPFTDVPAWAQPYVTACYADNIIAGTSATTFGGSGNVTAVQAGLMVLKTLGYFQYTEDFGEDWQLATVKKASEIELYDGIDAGRTDALTRNEVAQLVLNALESDVVEFTGTLGTDIKTTDGTTIKVGFQSKYDSITRSSEAGNNYAGGTTGADGLGYQQLCEKLYSTDLKKSGATDDFGRSATEWKYKTDSIGKYSDKADATYANKVSKATLYDLVGKSVVDDLKDAGETAATLTVIIDGRTVQNAVKDSNVNDYFASKNTASIGDTGTSGTAVTGNGTSTEVYVNDDTNAVKIVIINTYLIQATDDYNTKKETVTTQTVGDVTAPVATAQLTISSDDFAVENVKDEDYLLITCAGSSASNKEIKSVELATVVTGNVGSYSSGNDVSIDGTVYKYAFKADTTSTAGKAVSYEIGEDTTVITDGNGYIMYVDEVTVASDKYVYITEVANDGTFQGKPSYVADAYFLDGTHATISVKDKLADGTTAVGPTVTGQNPSGTQAGWYTYTVNSSDKYTLGALASGKGASTTTANDAAATLVENGKVNINIGKTGAIKANASTIFVIVDDDDNVTSYTGIANVPTIKNKATNSSPAYTALTAAYVKATNTSFAKYVFIDASEGASIDGATSASSDFIYLLKYDRTGKDAYKNDYYTYKAIVNGEETTVKLNDNYGASETAYRLYTDVKYDENGYVDSMNAVDSNDDYTKVNQALSDASIGYEDGILTLDTDFVVDKDCEIYLIAADTNVKEDDGATYELSAGISANSLYNTLKSYNGKIDGAYYAQVDDDTDTLVALYIYVSATV